MTDLRPIDYAGHTVPDDGLTLADYWALARLDGKLDGLLALLGEAA